MAVLPIRMYPDPVLREPAAAVDVVDDAVRKLVRDMEDTMRAAPGIGLAAPQVGVQRRVLVYDVGEGLHALVNPRITERRGEIIDEEGCLSIPGLSFPVARAEWIRVEGLDAEGVSVGAEVEELEARVLQHEIDHLDGVLFLDRLDRDKRREALRVWREQTLHGDAPSRAPAARL
jgi:peptide deformylase